MLLLPRRVCVSYSPIGIMFIGSDDFCSRFHLLGFSAVPLSQCTYYCIVLYGVIFTAFLLLRSVSRYI